VTGLPATQGGWNAYVAMGSTPAERARRLAEAPEALRAAVADNTRTFFAVRKNRMKNQRGFIDLGVTIVIALAALGLLSLFRGTLPTPAPVELPLPPPLILPTIAEPELACLSDEAYLRLAERDTACRERVKTLEGIIRATHIMP